MPKSPYTRPSYYYGMPDMYMQMGYFPFPTQPAAEPYGRYAAAIPYVSAMASQCRYYLGQTEKMRIGVNTHGCGTLANPDDSGVQLYIHEYAVTNFSGKPLEAQIWFGQTKSIVGAKISTQISPGLVQLSACPSAQGKILFSSGTTEPPRLGVAVSTKILPPQATSVFEKSGHWILNPGTAMMVSLHSLADSENFKGEFLFSAGWWEQPLFA